MASVCALAAMLPGCGAFFALVLQAVPTEVLTVRDDPDTFAPDDHPLTDVVSGTVIDPAAQLAGFWGNVRTTEMTDAATGAMSMVQIFTVMEYDLDASELRVQEIRELESGDRFVTLKVWSLEILGNNRYRQTFVSGQAARLTDDNQAVFDLLAALLADVDTGISFESLFTVDGDALRILNGAIGSTPEEIIAAGNEEGQTTLWVRLPN